jgi:hypothetical protein
MIHPPRRSVTRFFIPLVDVMMLLFCIFLLMPMVKFEGEGSPYTKLSEAERQLADRDERLRQQQQEIDRLRRELGETPAELRKDIQALREEKLKALQQRLSIRVLEIDGSTGKLYYKDPGPVEIRNKADAQVLIDRDRRIAAGGRQEVYYLILYPRERSPFPERQQREQYEQWFKDVAHGWDIPGTGHVRGGEP